MTARRLRSVHGVRAAAAAFAALATMLAGCTFLISFDEPDAVDDGGGDAPFRPDPPDVRVDAPDSSDGAIDAGPDARDAIANPAACKGKLDGRYCGGNRISWPADRKDDLITCKDSGVDRVRFCDQGVGCIAMVNGYADECDECKTKPDGGTFCGRDMPGWASTNMNVRVRCENGREVGLLICNATCKSNGGASSCQ